MQERIKKEILNIICKPQFDGVMIMPGAVDDAVQAIMAVFEESLPKKQQHQAATNNQPYETEYDQGWNECIDYIYDQLKQSKETS